MFSKKITLKKLNKIQIHIDVNLSDDGQDWNIILYNRKANKKVLKYLLKNLKVLEVKVNGKKVEFREESNLIGKHLYYKYYKYFILDRFSYNIGDDLFIIYSVKDEKHEVDNLFVAKR